ncbi:MAG: zinc ribbon domain-containing protein [Ruminococcaceae bacterium]|nr:zinc ribbon domain-containing protein [Oscillospiraceae bacterium]
MFCPRCGRAINETANFCGGCGLSRAEIEKFAQAAKVTNEAAQQTNAVTAPETPEVKSEAAYGTVVNEPAPQPECQENCAEKTEEQILKDILEDNTDYTTEKAAEPAPQPQAPKAEPAQTYTAPAGAEYHWSANTAAQPVKPVKNENLSTVDFIWMMLISSIPLVGLIYIIYLAIQDNNTNKRSFARATLIISLFAAVVSFVFIIGFIIAGL